ncbi:putative ribonuclease H-like domain-containing protein [Tanacetum coccineum]|uniref:Ribonuclease H-like domain-containing protein n=1 Tax=Tanacetum coccineum TaxID=301880 RepID=A0ABQ5F7T1_9ASTR
MSPETMGNPRQELKDKGVTDSGCSRHMTRNRSYLTDYEEIDGGFVAFGGNSKGGKITGKDFKLTDESHVLLKVPREDNMYSVDLKNVVPQGGLTCLFAKATPDESNLWHRRLGHVNFSKNYNQCVARTPQQNGVAKRKNRTLIEAARTMLADSKLPTTFWAEAVDTACYVQNKVLVIKPHNKTPYKLFLDRKPALSFMRPFRCPVTIFNTMDHLGKFNGKAIEGFFVGYSTNSKAFRVFNSTTRIVEENLHVQFRYQSNGSAGTKACDNVGKARVETVSGKDYILLPLWTQDPPFSSSLKDSPDAGFKPSGEEEKKDDEDLGNEDSENQKVIQALKDPSWIEAMQEELLQFKLQEVWTLVKLPTRKRAIGTKWVFMNNKDEKGIVIKNKARLVAHWLHKRRIDMMSVCPGFQIDAIRAILSLCLISKILLGCTSMDVKSAFYSDDIIFGSTKKSLCTDFEKMMHKKFQMSSLGKLTFFLGLQVKQKEDGIFISQDKYVNEILNQFGFSDVKTAKTPMETQKALLKDADGKDVDEHLYRSMIGSLMYLTSSRPDIMFAVCACVRFQVNPKVSHLHVMKRIFRYLKGQPKLGFWYPKDSPFDLVAYTNSDYAGASLDRKSITGGALDPKSIAGLWI